MQIDLKTEGLTNTLPFFFFFGFWFFFFILYCLGCEGSVKVKKKKKLSEEKFQCLLQLIQSVVYSLFKIFILYCFFEEEKYSHRFLLGNLAQALFSPLLSTVVEHYIEVLPYACLHNVFFPSVCPAYHSMVLAACSCLYPLNCDSLFKETQHRLKPAGNWAKRELETDCLLKHTLGVF